MTQLIPALPFEADTAPRQTRPSLPFARSGPSPALALLDAADFHWITTVIDTIAAAAGQPWRVALDHIEPLRRHAQTRRPRHFDAVVSAIQRLLGGRARNARLARTARELVLGPAVFDPSARLDRIAIAARALGISVAGVETLLWSDLPRERPVELPDGRPSELAVAAIANVHLIQRAVRRAEAITLRIRGDAGAVLRGAALRGLLVSARATGEETIVELIGPLALCHRTSVYGRAIGALVPLLAGCTQFELELHAHIDGHGYRARASSPVLLPAVPARLLAPGVTVTKLARELARHFPDAVMTTQPSPLAAGDALVCPDLVLDDGTTRWCVEIIGFWTPSFLRRKLASYAALHGTQVLLCVDRSRGCSDEEIPDDARVVPFTKSLPTDAIVGRIRRG